MPAQRIEIFGNWDRRIAGTLVDTIPVPGSYPPVGECTLETIVRVPRPAGDSRLFLWTEGVLAKAEFFWNGQSLGFAGPWSAYRFEIPPGLLREENALSAHVSDITEYFGPTPGRRFDAGLVRDIWLEERPAAFLRDVHFQYELSEDHSAARCRVEVEMDGGEDTCTLTLTERATGHVVATGTAAPKAPAEFSVAWPRLWSPQSPDLYDLRVALAGDGDGWVEAVGFRHIEVRGPDFFLNGRRLTLKGVCRHEFTPQRGYSPTDEEVRRDMALIRHAGFNYVRLVHSPESRAVSRAAAELGLLVSEEPGTCFHDLGDERVVAPALECLDRLVRRDRNVPSVFAWLLYNECNPNTEYARRAAQIVRDLDPGRLIGMADCSGRHDEVKAMVREADLDFYGINVYSFHPGEFENRMEIYADRPLVFTEWGGWNAQGNPRVRKDLCDMFVRHAQLGEARRTAGFAFWAWQDYEEYSRDPPAALEGWTVEGLIDSRGRPKEDLLGLSQCCFEMDHPAPLHAPQITPLSPAPARPEHWQSVALAGVGGDQAALEREVEAVRAKYRERPPALGRLRVAGLPFDCLPAPLLLGPERDEVFLPIGQTVRSVAVLGHVALRGGYPASGVWSVHHRDAEPVKALGADAGEYVLEFDDGQSLTLPLRHGLEVARANDLCRWWKTAPRTSATRPAVEVVVHPSYEILRVDLWEYALPAPRRLTGLRWRLRDPDAILALWALSVQVVE